jgi:TolA-binding protein
MAAKREWQSLAKVVRDSVQGKVAEPVHAQERAKFLAAFRAIVPGENTQTHGLHSWLRGWRMPFAVGAAALVVGLVFFLSRKTAPIALTYQVTGAVADRGYLQLPDGTSTAAVSFSDGSRIQIEPSTSARIAGVNAEGAHLVLERGLLDVDVVHHAGAAWTIEAGPYEVAITGTAFSISWDSDELTVTMIRGSVLVKGPLATSGVSVLGGQKLLARGHEHSLSIVDQTRAPNPLEDEGSPASAGSAQAQEPALHPSATAGATASSGTAGMAGSGTGQSWSVRVASGDYRSVLREAEEKGLEATLSNGPLADLAALADAARYVRRNDVARQALVAERSRFPHSSEAHAAQFLLARLVEEQGDVLGATSGYDLYLRESPRGSFAQEAMGRELTLLRRRGDRTAALPIAERYLREFPLGPYAHLARDVTGAP